MTKKITAFITTLITLFAVGLYLILQDHTGWQELEKELNQLVEVLPSSSPTPVLGTQQAHREEVLVTRVIDGDTIELADGRKVRYIGVDTPELTSSRSEAECFAEAARNFNQSLVLDQKVQLEKDVNETDRYGRLLRYVWIGDQLVNTKLVEEGYALARSYPPDIARQDELKQAESRAQSKNAGLWASCPQP